MDEKRRKEIDHHLERFQENHKLEEIVKAKNNYLLSCEIPSSKEMIPTKGDIEGLLKEAQSILRKGDLLAARHLFEKVIANAPYEERLANAIDNKDYPQIFLLGDYLAEIVALALCGVGIEEFDKGNIESALEFFEEASFLDPENEVLQHNIAKCYQEQGFLTPDEVVALYQKILEKHPNSGEAFLGISQELYKNGNLGLSVELLNRACEAEPHNRLVWDSRKHYLKKIEREWGKELAFTTPYLSKSDKEASKELLEALKRKGWEEKADLYHSPFQSVDYCKKTTDPKISVIVVAYKPQERLQELFLALEEQSEKNFEVVFVNNGASSEEFDSLKPYIHTYVTLGYNTGGYFSRNLGALFAKAPILLFLDDDGTPEKNCLEAHLTAFDNYHLLAVRGAVFGREETIYNEPRKRIYFPGEQPFPSFMEIEGNSSFDAEAFYKVKGWDDNTFIGGGGPEISLRLLSYDPDMRKQIFWPGAILYHDYANNDEEFERKEARIGKSYVRQRLKGIREEFVKIWEPLQKNSDLLVDKEKEKEVDRLINGREFDKALKIDPLSSRAYLRKAEIAEEKEENTEALEYYRKASALMPFSEKTILKQANLCKKLELFDEAKQICQEFLKLKMGEENVITMLEELHEQSFKGEKKKNREIYNLKYYDAFELFNV